MTNYDNLWRSATLITAIAAIGSVGSLMADSSPFTFEKGDELKVQWRGEPLILRDILQAVPSGKPDAPEGEDVTVKEGRTITNRWRVSDPHGQVTWRREIVNDDREMELSMIYRVPSYYYEGKPEKLDSFYRVVIGLERFEGAHFQALMREGTSYQTVKGRVLDGEMVPALSGRATWVTLEDPKSGKPVSFDFGPPGMTSFNSYVGPNSMPESWWVTSEKGALRAAVGRLKSSMTPHNGIYIGKVVVREAAFEDYLRYHAFDSYLYFDAVPPYRQYHFGARPAKGMLYPPIEPRAWRSGSKRTWQAIGNAPYASELGAGWTAKEELQITGKPEQGVMQSGLKGRGAATLRVDLPDSGIYIFTLRASGGAGGVGLFDLSAGGEVAVKGGRIGGEEINTYTFARHVKEGFVELAFSGQWTLNTLAVQKLIHSPEDFAFARGFWRNEALPAPTTQFSFERPPIPALAAVQTQPATKGSGGRKGVYSMHPSIAFPQHDPEQSWRWESDINSLGPSRGNIREFETDAQITRRLDELLGQGYKVLLINPELIRHAIPEEHARMRKTMKRIAAHAHERGMKVFDHFDVTIIPNMGAAYQEMVQNLDWTQRSVRTGQITRGYCINNPHFQKHFTDMMVAYAKESNIDGMMLDEVCWHTEAFCGCEYCREKFRAETKLELPSDGEHPDLLNHQSRLWKEWLQWRIRAQGDFCVKLLSAVREVRPDFAWMKYGAPTVYVSDYSTVRSGISLSEVWRFANYFGIEILSSNLHASYRSNLAVGSIFNSLTQGMDTAAFGLVYHRHSPIIAYAGWAQNNMNRQRTWFTYGNREIEMDSPRYTRWKENMPLEHVLSQAEVGVWFSEQSRDFSDQKKVAMEDAVGMCEQLDDLHIPYDVLQDVRISAERLDAYRLIVLPDAVALSDAQIALLRGYLERGGRVLATGQTGRQDELGFDREEWALRPMLNAVGSFEPMPNSLLDLPASDAGEAVSVAFALEPVSVQPGKKRASVEVLHELDYQGVKVPGTIRAAVGKGELIWASMLLGAENFHHDARNNSRPVPGRENPAARRLLGDLLNRMLEGGRRFHALSLPEKVAIRHYATTPRAKEGPTAYLHLYNGSGSTFKVNEPTPTTTPSLPYPKVSQAIVFEIEAPFEGPAQADYVTPDTPKILPLEIERTDGQRWKVSLPAGTLEAYGMVRLRPAGEKPVADASLP